MASTGRNSSLSVVGSTVRGMGGWVWLAPVGTVVGAVLAYFGARAGVLVNREATGQRERAARREEWGRRFATALEYLGDERSSMRMVGHTMLVQLLRSNLASSDDRDLGQQVIAADLADYDSQAARARDVTLLVDTGATPRNDQDPDFEERGP